MTNLHVPMTPSELPAWFPDSETKFVSRGTVLHTIVRDAVPADAHGVAAIGRSAVPETYRPIIPDESVMEAIVAQSYALGSLRACISACMVADDGHFLVAEEHGRIVGFLHFDSEGREAELHRIYVDPALKRRGIGSALLEELNRRLPVETSYVLMVVAANQPAVSFYERHGFVEAARVDGVAYMREHMGVDFPRGAQRVPALILRFTKSGSSSG